MTLKLAAIVGALLVAEIHAFSQFSGGGSRTPTRGGYGGYGHQPSNAPQRLDLHAAIRQAGEQKDLIQAKQAMISMQKSDVIKRLQDVLEKLGGILTGNDAQDALLIGVKHDIKTFLHNISSLEAEVIEQTVLSHSVLKNLDPLQDRLTDLAVNNVKQDALFESLHEILAKATELLTSKLNGAETTAMADLTKLRSNVDSFRDLIHTKKCNCTEDVTVTLTDGKGTETITHDLFKGQTPTATCVIKGFQLQIDSVNYGYYGRFDNGPEATGLGISCKAFEDKVEVTALDHSRGAGNDVMSVVVDVKLCTYSAVAKAPEVVDEPVEVDRGTVVSIR